MSDQVNSAELVNKHVSLGDPMDIAISESLPIKSIGPVEHNLEICGRTALPLARAVEHVHALRPRAKVRMGDQDYRVQSLLREVILPNVELVFHSALDKGFGDPLDLGIPFRGDVFEEAAWREGFLALRLDRCEGYRAVPVVFVGENLSELGVWEPAPLRTVGFV